MRRVHVGPHDYAHAVYADDGHVIAWACSVLGCWAVESCEVRAKRLAAEEEAIERERAAEARRWRRDPRPCEGCLIVMQVTPDSRQRFCCRACAKRSKRR